MKGENMELKTTLDKKMTERFQAVKESVGVIGDKEVLAILISKEYSRIQRRKYRKVFIPNEDYDIIEKASADRGQTVDEYITELTLKMLENAKEGVKRAEN
jgi:hypothetical protein